MISLRTQRKLSGLTLLEVIMVVALLAILSGFTVISLRPGENLAETRNLKRRADVTQILSAISLYVSEQGNQLSDFGSISTCPTRDAIGTSGINLGASLVPNFLPEIPVDPSSGNPSDTGYEICQGTAGRIQIEAPDGENGASIIVSR